MMMRPGSSSGARASTGSPGQLQQPHSLLLRRSTSPCVWGDARGVSGVGGASAAATYLFSCDAWLDETLGDGLTKRRLPVARWARRGRERMLLCFHTRAAGKPQDLTPECACAFALQLPGAQAVVHTAHHDLGYARGRHRR
jgi:hypothetical protein